MNIFHKIQDFKFIPTIDSNDSDREDNTCSSTSTGNEDNSSNIISRPVHVVSRRQALDPSGTHTLRNYVSHRKDTIVQRVIGYNYDDHSTAGGLYIRVGIGSKRKIA
jgi:hypothetical protein